MILRFFIYIPSDKTDLWLIFTLFEIIFLSFIRFFDSLSSNNSRLKSSSGYISSFITKFKLLLDNLLLISFLIIESLSSSGLLIIILNLFWGLLFSKVLFLVHF